MGFTFGDFMQDITLPLQIEAGVINNVVSTAGGVATSVTSTIGSSLSSVASSLSLPLMIGGGAILLIMLNKK